MQVWCVTLFIVVSGALCMHCCQSYKMEEEFVNKTYNALHSTLCMGIHDGRGLASLRGPCTAYVARVSSNSGNQGKPGKLVSHFPDRDIGQVI